VLETASPDRRCVTCGALPQAFDFACEECTRRWEEMECRQLRERLFDLSTPPEHGY
jgi:predicted nucleic acid-binding Zn ribbon protein